MVLRVVARDLGAATAELSEDLDPRARLRLIFGWSIFGLLFVALAAFVTEKKVREGLAHAAPEHTEEEAWDARSQPGRQALEPSVAHGVSQARQDARVEPGLDLRLGDI